VRGGEERETGRQAGRDLLSSRSMNLTNSWKSRVLLPSLSTSRYKARICFLDLEMFIAWTSSSTSDLAKVPF
jgi:hypothetical protein